jgi:hypothetical protein
MRLCGTAKSPKSRDDNTDSSRRCSSRLRHVRSSAGWLRWSRNSGSMSAADAGGTHGKPHTRMTVAGSASRGGSAIAGRTSFAHDSLLEGDGFEPSVPLYSTYRFGPPSCRFRERAKFAVDSLLEGAGFEPSVPRECNGENAKEPVSLLERKVPEMSSTGRRLSIFTSGFSRD